MIFLQKDWEYSKDFIFCKSFFGYFLDNLSMKIIISVDTRTIFNNPYMDEILPTDSNQDTIPLENAEPTPRSGTFSRFANSFTARTSFLLAMATATVGSSVNARGQWQLASVGTPWLNITSAPSTTKEVPLTLDQKKANDAKEVLKAAVKKLLEARLTIGAQMDAALAKLKMTETIDANVWKLLGEYVERIKKWKYSLNDVPAPGSNVKFSPLVTRFLKQSRESELELLKEHGLEKPIRLAVLAIKAAQRNPNFSSTFIDNFRAWNVNSEMVNEVLNFPIGSNTVTSSTPPNVSDSSITSPQLGSSWVVAEPKVSVSLKDDSNVDQIFKDANQPEKSSKGYPAEVQALLNEGWELKETANITMGQGDMVYLQPVKGAMKLVATTQNYKVPDDQISNPKYSPIAVLKGPKIWKNAVYWPPKSGIVNWRAFELDGSDGFPVIFTDAGREGEVTVFVLIK